MNLLKKVKKNFSFYDIGFPLLALYFFVLLPVLISFLNPDDTELHSLHIFSVGILITLLLSVIYSGVNLLLKIPEILKKTFIALSLFVFIKIIFFPTQTGLIDGLKKETTIDFNIFIDLFIFILLLIFVIVFLFHKKTDKFKKPLIIATFAIAFIIVIFSIFSADSNLSVKKMLWDSFETDMKDKSAFTEFGTEKNIIIILWDGIQGTIAESAFADSPRAMYDYDGFIFYPYAIGSGPLTTRILPVLYSGEFKMYYAQSHKIISKIMYNNSFFIDAKEHGFRVASKGLWPAITIGGFNNFNQFQKLKSVKKGTTFSKYLFFLYASQKRITPKIVQSIILPWINKIRKAQEDDKDNTTSAGKDNLVEKMEEYFDIQKFKLSNYKKKLLYLHPLFAHEPYCNKSTCNYSTQNAKYVISCALINVTVSLFKKLKELGIYDSSLILVISDHGSRVAETSKGIRVGKTEYDLSYTGISRYPAGAYNPLIMVKKPFSKGKMKVSYKPAMQNDIRSFISAYLNNKDFKNEPLLYYKNVSERDVQLILTIDPKQGKSLETHTFIHFKGTLENIPVNFNSKNY